VGGWAREGVGDLRGGGGAAGALVEVLEHVERGEAVAAVGEEPEEHPAGEDGPQLGVVVGAREDDEVGRCLDLPRRLALLEDTAEVPQDGEGVVRSE